MCSYKCSATWRRTDHQSRRIWSMRKQRWTMNRVRSFIHQATLMAPPASILVISYSQEIHCLLAPLDEQICLRDCMGDRGRSHSIGQSPFFPPSKTSCLHSRYSQPLSQVMVQSQLSMRNTITILTSVRTSIKEWSDVLFVLLLKKRKEKKIYFKREMALKNHRITIILKHTNNSNDHQ